jgi:hypothetical protein
MFFFHTLHPFLKKVSNRITFWSPGHFFLTFLLPSSFLEFFPYFHPFHLNNDIFFLIFFQFHPVFGILLFYNTCRTNIMESYWCTHKNSIIDMTNGKKIPIALTPCLMSECDMWRDGKCIHIRKAGNQRTRI